MLEKGPPVPTDRAGRHQQEDRRLAFQEAVPLVEPVDQWAWRWVTQAPVTTVAERATAHGPSRAMAANSRSVLAKARDASSERRIRRWSLRGPAGSKQGNGVRGSTTSQAEMGSPQVAIRKG